MTYYIVFKPYIDEECQIPMFLSAVPAGFPSPAEDYIEGKLDLNQYLIKHPAATFFVKATGDSMIGAGIHPGDILVVDRSLDPADRRVVIAVVNGELAVKRIRKINNRIWLMSENAGFAPVCIDDETAFEIWGVVTSVIHPL